MARSRSSGEYLEVDDCIIGFILAFYAAPHLLRVNARVNERLRWSA